MTTNLTPDIAALPLYQLGFHNGQDVGLRLALDALTAERGRQERLSADGSGSQACRAYADGRLLAVARVIAARFRQ